MLKKKPTCKKCPFLMSVHCHESHQSFKPQMFNSTIAAISVSNLVWWHHSCCVESWELRKQRLLDLCCPGNLQAPRMNGGEGRRWDHHYLVSLLLSRLPLKATIQTACCATCACTRTCVFHACWKSWMIYSIETSSRYCWSCCKCQYDELRKFNGIR